MNKKKLNSGLQNNMSPFPGWFSKALSLTRESELFTSFNNQQHHPSLIFQQRCHKSAEVALTIVKIRKERKRIGFAPLPLAEYVKSIAANKGCVLSPVLKWLGIKDLFNLNYKTAKSFAKFAKVLGMSHNEALVHICIGFAKQHSIDCMLSSPTLSRAAIARGSQFDEGEELLRQLDSQLNPNDLEELNFIKSEIRSEFAM